MPEIEARPGNRPLQNPVHSSITAEQISDLVDKFYDAVHANEILGPIFDQQTTVPWNEHLKKMKSFWRSVLLKTGEYKGKPVPKHQQLTGVETLHFEEWLRLFSQTSAEIFCEEAAPAVNEAAVRIATSLWLSRNSDPFTSPPAWGNILRMPTNGQIATDEKAIS